MKKLKISLLILSFCLATGFTAKVHAESRIGGQDRYDTSIKISQSGWSTADNVVLTTGTGDNTYADALSGTVLAYKLNAPILLTDTNALNSNIASEIARLKAKNIYILGGYGVVSKNVEQQLQTQGYNIVRVAGADRYETAVKVAEKNLEISTTDTAYITTGYSFQYAMLTSPIASVNNKIVLFSESSGLNQTTQSFLLEHPEITNVVLVGDGNYTSSKLVSDLKSLSLNVTTQTGTLTDLEKQFITENKDTFTNVSLANKDLYADALGGAVLSAKNKSLLILTDKDAIDSDLNESISANLNVKNATVFGGTAVISDTIYNQVTGNITVPENTSINATSSIVPIKSKELEQAIRDTISKPTGGLTQDDFDKIKLLVINPSEKNMDSLEGIQNLRNLKYLRFDINTNVTDLTPLASLPRLEELMMLNYVDDTTPLKNIKTLRNLVIGVLIGAKNFDLSELTNLEYLGIGATGMVNKTVPSKLYSGYDVNFVSNLKKLKRLDISHNQISDFSFLKGLDNLEEVNVGYNEDGKDLTPLLSLPKLKIVHLDPGQLEDNDKIKNDFISKGIELDTFSTIRNVFLEYDDNVYSNGEINDNSNNQSAVGFFNKDLASKLREKIVSYRNSNNLKSDELPNFRKATEKYVDEFARYSIVDELTRGNTISVNDSEKYKISHVQSTIYTTESADADADAIFNDLKYGSILLDSSTVDLAVSIYNNGEKNYVAIVLTNCTKVGSTTGK